MSTNHSQPNPLTASEKTAHPQTDTANSPTSTTDAHPNALTTSEKANEAGRGEERAVEPFVPPTANEVRRFAETLHHPEFDAEWFVAYYTERHWRRHNGRPVVSWQTTARYWLDYPLRVARHLLDHRPAASPVSVGVGGSSAVVVPAAGTTAAKPVGTGTHPAAGPTSSTSPGTYPVGTGGLSPRSSASPVGTGAPHVGSLSLPAPTPLQQSRLSDLKGMVLHLFADAPAATPASASTAPDLSSAAPDVPHAAADVPANASTPDWVARNSVRPARVLSPAEAAQVIAQQTLAVAEAEAVPHVVHDSTADAEEIIDTQAFSIPDAEEDALNGYDSTTDAEEDIDTQALSPAHAKESVRSCDDSTDDAEEIIDTQASSTPNAAKGIETQVLSPAAAKKSVRACDDSTDENGEEIGTQAFSIPDAAKGIDAQALSPADAEKSVRACDDSTDDAEEDALNGHDSTTDNAEDIDAQAFSTADAEEEALNGHDSLADYEEGIETQAFSTTDAAGSLGARAFSADKGRWGVRSPRGPDPPTDDGHDSNAIRHDSTDTGNDFADTGNDFTDAENNFTAKPSNFSADRHPPADVGTALAADSPISPADECRPLHTFTEKHPYLNPSFHEPHPLLRLHPPSFGGFGRTFRVQSVQPPFGRSFLGRFVDIRPACTVGSRPLRPRLTLCRTARGRCRPEHPDRECTNAADAVERSANAIRPPSDEPEHGTDGHQTERNAPEHTADGRKRHDSAPERSANEPEHTADAPEHDAQCAKNADFIDADPVHGHQTERNAAEHPADGRKRHDPALEHTADDPERSANAVSTPADAAEHGAQCAKNADFIDVDPARGHRIEHNAVEHPTNAVSPLADESEHPDCERKRHDSAPEHPVRGHQTERNEPEHRADECPDPAYDLDAGQRVLRSAAHRRAVRAELEACCGALRHLAHCCVAF